jgi:cellulose synthase/poly-beta-1,6-N-acetylglucosamine synthase-like glycosyltransferase
MFALAAALVAAPLVGAIYAYIGYPVILLVIAKMRPRDIARIEGAPWPSVTITVPVYNGESTIRATLASILQLDYPKGLLQVLVISDASTDGTDDVVRDFASRGVELLRHGARVGKTAGENAAHMAARGTIIVNIDATVSVPATSLKPLVRVFDDSTIGMASGRDVSVGDADNRATGAESRYVGYEMWIRDLETAVGSIVGASGCFYAVRRGVHSKPLPPDLSWDFASALVARQQGYRSVSVPAAVCMVPRTARLGTELKRKVRTMARGISTLFYYRELMNPTRYGGFALMLVSHKLLRWLPYLLAPLALLAISALAIEDVFARAVLATIFAGFVVGIAGLGRHLKTVPAPVAFASFIVASFVAGFMAWWTALRHTQLATWEPTPRPEPQT